MAYLQLAENRSEAEFYHSLAEEPKKLYLFVPKDETGADGVWVREDYFDNLPPDEWQKTMIALAPYQPAQLSGVFSNIRTNIQERRARRDVRRDARTERVRTGQTFGGRLLDTVSGIFGKGQTDASTREMQLPQYDINVGSEPQKQWYQNPAVIVGGLALVGGAIYLATRKKGKK